MKKVFRLKFFLKSFQNYFLNVNRAKAIIQKAATMETPIEFGNFSGIKKPTIEKIVVKSVINNTIAINGFLS